MTAAPNTAAASAVAPHETPALSIVVASRNDEHGGNILQRMRFFLAGLLTQTRRYRISAELVFVEWNPPADRPRLREVLPRPSADDSLTLRYVEVPAAIHDRYRRALDVPLFQMIAKNVGIRRARAPFILCTNVDLLLSDALIRSLATTALQPDTYYRANRCDVPDGIDPAWDLDAQLLWCERHVIRRLGRDSRYPNINLELLGLQHSSPAGKWVFNKMIRGTSLLWSPEKRAFYQLDTFACGDFTLMSREAWHAIGGYVELDMYSLHVDSLGLIAASALGYRQHVFPRDACTYHIDHPSGWQALTALEKVRFLEQRPALDYSLLYEVALEALRNRQAVNLNAPDWGYAGTALEEFTFPARSGPVREVRQQAALSGGG